MYTNKNPKIFLLAGKAESGKNFVAELIEHYYKNQKVKQLSYTHYLKEYVKDIAAWDGSEESKPRTLLQEFGISFLKEKIDDQLLIRRTIEDIRVYSYFYDVIIITGARLKEEIEQMKKSFSNIYTMHILREHYISKLSDNEKKHYTEIDLDSYSDFDYEIYNDVEIEETIKKILKEIDNEK